jgi:predicted dehydrogenase
MAGANRSGAGEATMATKPLNIGMVGYGFMGRAHSNAYRRVANFFETGYQPVLKAACARNAGKLAAFAEQWGYESVETDWRKLIARKDIDAVDICTPNDSHAEIAIAAAKAGKMVLCEKPLARNAKEALPMVKAVEKAGVPNMVWYNYRRVPAVSLIKQVVDSGRLGKIYHYRAKFLQDWTISPDVPQGGAGTWRLDVDAAGSGVTGDLIAHCVDSAIWINGSIASLTAMTETFIKKRKHALTGKVQDVGIDDAAAVLTRFQNGSLGTFESTRYARGHKALYTLEINGQHGSFAWDLHDLNRLQWFDHRVEGPLRGWTSILVTDGEHPYLGKWWVPGLSIGYEHSFVHQIADFLTALSTGKPASPTFREALETTIVCDAIIKSGQTGKWQEVKKG